MLLRDSLIKILVLLLVLGQVLDFIHVKASAENEERPYAKYTGRMHFILKEAA